MRTPREFTSSELAGCLEHSAALLKLTECLPDHLRIVLDTFWADCSAEAEDRQTIRLDSRRRARVAEVTGDTGSGRGA